MPFISSSPFYCSSDSWSPEVPRRKREPFAEFTGSARSAGRALAFHEGLSTFIRNDIPRPLWTTEPFDKETCSHENAAAGHRIPTAAFSAGTSKASTAVMADLLLPDEVLLQRPEPEGRVADVKDLLAVDGVEPVFQLGRIVFLHHGVEVAALEPDRTVPNATSSTSKKRLFFI